MSKVEMKARVATDQITQMLEGHLYYFISKGYPSNQVCWEDEDTYPSIQKLAGPLAQISRYTVTEVTFWAYIPNRPTSFC